MDREKKIQNEVNKTLDQFDQAERLKPNPYLATRIEALVREEQKEKSWNLGWGLLKPALMLVVVAANILTVSAFLGYNSETPESNDKVSVFAQEFGLETTVSDPFTFIE